MKQLHGLALKDLWDIMILIFAIFTDHQKPVQYVCVLGPVRIESRRFQAMPNKSPPKDSQVSNSYIKSLFNPSLYVSTNLEQWEVVSQTQLLHFQVGKWVDLCSISREMENKNKSYPPPNVECSVMMLLHPTAFDWLFGLRNTPNSEN